jgi:hypothetical protein
MLVPVTIKEGKLRLPRYMGTGNNTIIHQHQLHNQLQQYSRYDLNIISDHDVW